MINRTIIKEKSELHLFIIWNNGFQYADQILDLIQQRFVIKLDRIHTWSEDLFVRNLNRFYGKKLPENSKKEQEVGIGPFRILVVEDLKPVYSPRRIRNDADFVNAGMFDIKQHFRRKLKTNILHATNSEEEFSHDITLLLGMTPAELIDADFVPRCETDPQFGMDLWGARGWKSIQEMLKCMNHSLRYIILRNFENYPEKIQLGPHSDLDMLCDSKTQAALILNAVPTTKVNGRVQHRVAIGDDYINVDIRSVGDRYYDLSWEKHMLESRRYHNNGFYVMNDIDYVYSLAYHALIQKKKISEDYIERIKVLQEKAGIASFDLGDRKAAAEVLSAFLKQNHYQITEPSDPTVAFNTLYFDAGESFGRILRGYKKRLKKKIKRLLGAQK